MQRGGYWAGDPRGGYRPGDPDSGYWPSDPRVAYRPGNARWQGGPYPPVPPARPRRSRRGWLLGVAIVAPLLSPLANRDSPEFWGIPFFYWYQLFCCLLVIALITAVFLRSRERRHG